MHFVALSSAYAQTTDFFELVKTGTPQDVQTAIGNGADINPRNEYYGETPLIYAAQYNPNPAVITTLLKAGADAKAKDNIGQTAFDWAQGDATLKGTDAYRMPQQASQ